VAAGSGNGDLIAAAAESLGNGCVSTWAIENDVSGDAAGERAVLVDMAHATQVSLAFFANVAKKDERDGQIESRVQGVGMEKRARDGEHSGYTGGVVAGAWSLKTIAIEDGAERSVGREHSVNVRGEQNDRASAVCGSAAADGGQNAEDVSGCVDLDAAETDLSEALGEPPGARLLAMSRRGNRDQLDLPIHDGFGIGVQPGEGGVNRSLRGEGSNARERRS